MLKKRVIASVVAAFASLTPALAQEPAAKAPAAAADKMAPAAKPETPMKAAHKKPKKHPAKKVEAPKPATPTLCRRPMLRSIEVGSDIYCCGRHSATPQEISIIRQTNLRRKERRQGSGSSAKGSGFPFTIHNC